MADWLSPKDAPYGEYMLCFGGNLPWIDQESDPRFFVAKRTKRTAYGRKSVEEWVAFGPNNFTSADVTCCTHIPQGTIYTGTESDSGFPN